MVKSICLDRVFYILIDRFNPLIMKDLVELQKTSIEKIDPDILITRYKGEVDIDEDDAREIDGTHCVLSQGEDMFIIVDMTIGETRIHDSAEKFFIGKGLMVPYIKGMAIVCKSKSSFLTKFFKRSPKTLYPTKEFVTFEDAYTWIDHIRNKRILN